MTALEFTRCERCGLYWSMHLLLGCPDPPSDEGHREDPGPSIPMSAEEAPPPRTGTEPQFSACRCSEVKVGGKPTGSINWNPDCPVHLWDERLQAQADRAVEWQRRAREAREARRRAE